MNPASAAISVNVAPLVTGKPTVPFALFRNVPATLVATPSTGKFVRVERVDGPTRSMYDSCRVMPSPIDSDSVKTAVELAVGLQARAARDRRHAIDQQSVVAQRRRIGDRRQRGRAADGDDRRRAAIASGVDRRQRHEIVGRAGDAQRERAGRRRRGRGGRGIREVDCLDGIRGLDGAAESEDERCPVRRRLGIDAGRVGPNRRRPVDGDGAARGAGLAEGTDRQRGHRRRCPRTRSASGSVT